MAKGNDKTNAYLLGIVAVVAIVGIIVLVLNINGNENSARNADYTGMVYKSGLSAMQQKSNEPSAGEACTEHSDCRSGLCGPNGRCA